MNLYFDNAATTPLDPAVLEAMLPYYTQHWGNASATHRRGREARHAVETARQTVADLLGAQPDDIFFTSGATESDNMALTGSIRSGSIRDVITSPIEHKAVLQPLVRLRGSRAVATDVIRLQYVELDAQGRVDYDHLEELLDSRRNLGLSNRQTGGVLVSLMHGNNEVGNLTDIDRVAWICRQFGAYFHSDTVQTVGRYQYNLRELPVDFIVGSAHKFHGPQGVGFLYVRSPHQLPALLHGGNQEQGRRPGTENVAGIVGLAKALEISYSYLANNQAHVRTLKAQLIEQLRASQPDVQFNGTSAELDESLDTVLNVSLPPLPSGQSLVDVLDAKGIAVSGGSACSNLAQSGSTAPAGLSERISRSHVLQAIGVYLNRENIRISLSRFTSQAAVETLVKQIDEVYSAYSQAKTDVLTAVEAA